MIDLGILTNMFEDVFWGNHSTFMANIELTTLLFLCNLALLLIVWLVLTGRQRITRAELEKNKSEIKFLKNELQALYAGAAGVGGHLARIESQLHNVSDRQEQLDVRDSATLSYSEAIDLVHEGADEEELMARCGLLREEAELLIRLHRDDVEPVLQ